MGINKIMDPQPKGGWRVKDMIKIHRKFLVDWVTRKRTTLPEQDGKVKNGERRLCNGRCVWGHLPNLQSTDISSIKTYVNQQ